MRIAVFGAGYAGVTLARQLEQTLPEADLVVVDEDGTHLVQHELHRVVRKPSLAEHLKLPLDEVLDDADVRSERVVDVDPDGRVATLADGDTVEYDVGAVCLGAETDYHDLPGVRERATPLKRMADAHEIRSTFLEEVGDGRVVVGGAGLSGVQVAGELAALADERGQDATVTLLEQEDSVAPGFDEPFREAVHEALVAEGVDVRTGTQVTGAADGVLHLDGGELPVDQLVWTGGIRGPGALGGDRPRVRATMELADRTFVLGDAARVVDRSGEAVPATAQSAVGQAKVLARTMTRLVEDDGVFDPRAEQFDFDARGWVVSVGDRTVAQVGSGVVTGSPATAIKAALGARHLTGVGAVEDALDVVYSELGLTEE